MKVTVSEETLRILMGENKCQWCTHFTLDSLPICKDHMQMAVNCDGCVIDGLCVCSQCADGSHFVLNMEKVRKYNLDLREEKTSET